MESFHAFGCQAQGRYDIWGNVVVSRFKIGDAELLDVEVIELERVFPQGGIAAGAYIGQDGSYTFES